MWFWSGCRARPKHQPRSISPIAASRPPTFRWCLELRCRRSWKSCEDPLVVGLYASPERIVQIRQNRMLGLRAHQDDAQYVDREAVAEEVAFSRRLCARNNWPLIDVTRRSIEETAAAVLKLLAERRKQRLCLKSAGMQRDAVVAQRSAPGDRLEERSRAALCWQRRRSRSRSIRPISMSAPWRRSKRALPGCLGPADAAALLAVEKALAVAGTMPGPAGCRCRPDAGAGRAAPEQAARPGGGARPSCACCAARRMRCIQASRSRGMETCCSGMSRRRG